MIDLYHSPNGFYARKYSQTRNKVFQRAFRHEINFFQCEYKIFRWQRVNEASQGGGGLRKEQDSVMITINL